MEPYISGERVRRRRRSRLKGTGVLRDKLMLTKNKHLQALDTTLLTGNKSTDLKGVSR